MYIIRQSIYIIPAIKRITFILILSVCGSVSFALPSKQKGIIEKLMTEGSFEQALTHIEQLTGRYNEDPELLLLKGICYYKIDSYKPHSVELLTAALNRSQEQKITLDILYHLAQAHIANEDYIDAIKSFNKLQTLVPAKFALFHEKIENEIDFCSEMLKKYGATPKSHPIKQADKDSVSPTIAVQAIKDTLPVVRKVVATIDTTITPEKPKAGTQYTIQICTMSFPLADSFFKGQYSIKLIRIGDLYRYIYSKYNTVEEARKDLPKVRKIYPDAFIREYNEDKLGKAIDLDINKLNNHNN